MPGKAKKNNDNIRLSDIKLNPDNPRTFSDSDLEKMMHSISEFEKMWPDYVKTTWRFGRPQHKVKNDWKDFKHPLIRRTDIDWNEIKKKKYNFNLIAIDEVKSDYLKQMLKEQ